MLITMPYIIHQQIKGHVYAYEVTGEWDPLKKNSRQKRKYIGRVDEHGNIIPKRTSTLPKKMDGAYDFGDVFLILRVSRDLGLDSLLDRVFGNQGRKLLILATSRIIMTGGLRLVQAWLSRTYLEDRIESQRISEILSTAGKGSMEFAVQWLKSSEKEDSIYLDVTSLESYSTGNRFPEFGYSRSGRDEPRINLGVIMGRSMRPLFYDVYPGSIPDVKTLLNSLDMLEKFGITKIILVLDRGFYATYNIRALTRFTFIMPLPFRTMAAKNILRECMRMKPEHAQMHSGSLIYTRSGGFSLDEIKLHFTYYHDPDREGMEKKRFLQKLTRVEQDLHAITDMTRIDEVAGPYKKYLTIGPGLVIRRKNSAISRRLNRMGRMILMSNSAMEWNGILDLYRSRDRVEKGFRDMKSDLDALPMGTHTAETMQGYLLVQFLSLILESEMRRRMLASGLSKRMGLHEMLIELSKLRVVKLEDSRFLTEISKRQREIYQGMGIDEESVVIN